MSAPYSVGGDFQPCPLQTHRYVPSRLSKHTLSLITSLEQGCSAQASGSTTQLWLLSPERHPYLRKKKKKKKGSENRVRSFIKHQQKQVSQAKPNLAEPSLAEPNQTNRSHPLQMQVYVPGTAVSEHVLPTAFKPEHGSLIQGSGM